LKVLFPGIRITDKQMRLDEGDIDLFIVHAVSNVLYYQKELKKLEVRTVTLIYTSNIMWVCYSVAYNLIFFKC
jgi:hypothetical protein